MSSQNIIIDADKVIARFGDWPHFHDMEVVSVHMDRRGPDGPSMEFVVFAWKYTGNIAPEGHYEQSTHSLIRFRCESIYSNHLDGFNHQNVLDGLVVERSDEGINVQLCSIYGLGGTLNCARIRVVDVMPATSGGQPVD